MIKVNITSKIANAGTYYSGEESCTTYRYWTEIEIRDENFISKICFSLDKYEIEQLSKKLLNVLVPDDGIKQYGKF